MKRYIKYCVVLFAILFANCTSTTEGLDAVDVLIVSTDKIDVSCTGGKENVDVDSFCAYKVSSTEEWSWITSSVKNSGKGRNSIKFTFAENTTVKARTATITIANPIYDVSREISVLQEAGTPYINLSQQVIDSSAKGLEVDINTESNIGYTISSLQDWCKVDKNIGENGLQSFKITVDESVITTKRTATVVVANKEYDVAKEITVNQTAFAPSLEISDSSISTTTAGESKQITVTANITWNATCEANWVTLSPVNGEKGVTTFNIAIAANATTSERTATVKVTNSEYNITKEITVSQVAFAPSLEVSDSSISTTTAGESKQITVTANIPWNATCEASWVTLSPVNGEKGVTTFNIAIAANATTSERTATINIVNTEYNVVKQIAVSQNAFEATLDVNEATLSITSEQTTSQVTVTSNIPWNATCEADWVTLSPISGQEGTNVLKITATENTTTSARTATVKVLNSNLGITREITVNQNAFEPMISVQGATTLRLDYMGAAQLVAINSNVDYVANTEADWFILDKVENGISVTYTTNYSNNSTREATIILSNEQYLLNVVINVIQAAFPSDNVIRYTTSNNAVLLPGNTNAFGANIISLTNENGVGIITFDGPVTSIGENAFYNCTTLTNITIPSSLTSLGNNAFYGCSSLTSITIPDSVTAIGSSAFYDCNSLTSFTIPANVTAIENNLFYNCSSLATVTIPDKVTSIGTYAFYGCSSLTSITIPESVTSIGSKAFYGCSGKLAINSQNLVESDYSSSSYPTYNGWLNGAQFSEIAIGSNVTKIGNYTFRGCSSVTTITVPENITSIGTYAFYGCNGLTSITIPENVTSIGSKAFYGCSGKLVINSQNLVELNYNSSNYPAYNTGWLNGAQFSEIAIGSNVTKLGNYAFCGCSSVTTITMPENITFIGNSAFENCSSLENFTIPEKLTSIGNNVFYNCSKLTSVVIPEKVISLGNNAFYGCRSLTSVVIPASVTSFGENTFYGCTGELIINNEVVENNYYTSSNYPASNGNWLNGVKFSKLTIGESVKKIGNYMFRACSSLTSITIPNSVTSIGKYAFDSCNKLTSIVIPNSVTSIETYAFNGCNSLQSVYYGSTTPATLGSNAFANNASNRKIYVQAGCLSTYQSAWSDYSTSIEEVEYTPTECTALSITADDVSGNDTTTTLYYTAVTNGTTMFGNVSGIIVTGMATSEAFPQNTSTTETDTVTITYTYLGQTATTTITQGVYISKSYTVNLNNSWRESSKSNPDSSLYDGVYESESNWHVANGVAKMYIDITGYSEFSIYVRSYAESRYDYVIVYELDSTSSQKMSTSNKQNGGTSLSSYTKVTFNNIDGGSHRITIEYKKDSYDNINDDRGYLLIPKNQ